MRRFRNVQNFYAGPVGFGDILELWGYPRRPTLMEYQRSSIYHYGDDSIFWLERVESEWTTAIFHLAVWPHAQKQHGVAPRKLFRGLDVICDLEGIDRLIANDCTESGEVTDYLRRLGWKPCVMETIEGEWYERSFVDGEAQGESHEQASETEDCPSDRGRGRGSEARSEREGAQESSPAARTGRERVRTP